MRRLLETVRNMENLQEGRSLQIQTPRTKATEKMDKRMAEMEKLLILKLLKSELPEDIRNIFVGEVSGKIENVETVIEYMNNPVVWSMLSYLLERMAIEYSVFLQLYYDNDRLQTERVEVVEMVENLAENYLSIKCTEEAIFILSEEIKNKGLSAKFLPLFLFIIFNTIEKLNSLPTNLSSIFPELTPIALSKFKEAFDGLGLQNTILQQLLINSTLTYSQYINFVDQAFGTYQLSSERSAKIRIRKNKHSRIVIAKSSKIEQVSKLIDGLSQSPLDPSILFIDYLKQVYGLSKSFNNGLALKFTQFICETQEQKEHMLNLKREKQYSITLSCILAILEIENIEELTELSKHICNLQTDNSQESTNFLKSMLKVEDLELLGDENFEDLIQCISERQIEIQNEKYKSQSHSQNSSENTIIKFQHLSGFDFPSCINLSDDFIEKFSQYCKMYKLSSFGEKMEKLLTVIKEVSDSYDEKANGNFMKHLYFKILNDNLLPKESVSNMQPSHNSYRKLGLFDILKYEINTENRLYINSYGNDKIEFVMFNSKMQGPHKN
jgi:hypothetical protein